MLRDARTLTPTTHAPAVGRFAFHPAKDRVSKEGGKMSHKFSLGMMMSGCLDLLLQEHRAQHQWWFA